MKKKMKWCGLNFYEYKSRNLLFTKRAKQSSSGRWVVSDKNKKHAKERNWYFYLDLENFQAKTTRECKKFSLKIEREWGKNGRNTNFAQVIVDYAVECGTA